MAVVGADCSRRQEVEGRRQKAEGRRISSNCDLYQVSLISHHKLAIFSHLKMTSAIEPRNLFLGG
ncbi:hypothetical protein [Okeania sp. SIO2C2]|uniref:hypothetical protein n=1 Tax=Okeania sp. SIO2C2 TaxID=2607787 RepID=UPI00257E9CD5|nr:hypothetical protein [Okeania sp. SIO2C2]